MQLPALSIRQPDLGQSLMRAAQIKGAGLQNQLLESKMKRSTALTDILRRFSDAPQAPAQGDWQQPGGIGPEGGSGAPAAPTRGQGGMPDPARNPAFPELMAADPDMAMKFVDMYTKATAEQRKQIMFEAKRTVSGLIPIMQAPEEQRAQLYADLYARETQAGRSMGRLGPLYDPVRVKAAVAFAMGTSNYATHEGKRSQFYRDGRLQSGPSYLMQPGDKPAGTAKGAQSRIGQLAADLKSGIISDEQYQIGIDIAQKPLVNIGEEGAESKAYGKKMGEYFADRYTGTQKAAATARASNARLDRLDQLLDQTATGKFIATSVQIQKAAKTLGFDLSGLPGNVAPAEAAIALTNAMALELRSSMPGPMSDSDRDFLVSMAPGLGQTAEGRKLLIGTRRKVNKRLFKIAKMAREYTSKHGRIDTGFEDVLQAYSEKNPLFTKKDMTSREKARLPSLSGSGADRLRQYNELPIGTYFTSPDGVTRQKKKPEEHSALSPDEENELAGLRQQQNVA